MLDALMQQSIRAESRKQETQVITITSTAHFHCHYQTYNDVNHQMTYKKKPHLTAKRWLHLMNIEDPIK